MKTKAAIAYAAGKPLEVVEVDLQGPKAGVEVSANVTKVVITLDPSRSTPD